MNDKMTLSTSTDTTLEKSLRKWLNLLFVLFCFFDFYIFVLAVVWREFPSEQIVTIQDVLPSFAGGKFWVKPRDSILAILYLLFPIVAVLSWVVARKLISIDLIENKFFPLASWSLIALVTVVASLMWNDTSTWGWWPGFSVAQFTLGCVFAAITSFLIWKEKTKQLLFLTKAVTPLIIIYYLLLWIEFPWGMKEGSSPLLDEVLAPSAGAFPSINFTSQYINLLGWPITPFTALFPQHAVLIAYLWVDILKITTLVFSLYFLKATITKKWVSLFVILVVALPSISGLNESYWFNMTSYWAVFPMRLVLPLALGALLMWALQKPVSRQTLWLLGVVSAITAWNNTDWGIPAAGAALSVILLGTDSISEALRRMRHFFTGAFLFVGCYVLLLRVVTGYWSDPIVLFYFAKEFLKGGSISIVLSGWGLHFIVLGTFALVSVIGVIGYSKWSKSFYGNRSPYFAGLTYIGLFSLGTSLYFINRALPPILHSQFLQWAICIALLTYGAIRFLELGRTIPAISTNIALLTLPAFVLFGVTSMSILNGPRLLDEFERISGANSKKWTISWLSEIDPRTQQIEKEISTLGARNNIGLIANNSNVIATTLGMKSLSGFWVPTPFPYQSVLDRICWSILRSPIQTLVVDRTQVFPETLFTLKKCGFALQNNASSDLNRFLIMTKIRTSYQRIEPHPDLVNNITTFPATLPLVEIQIELRESKILDSVRVLAGGGEWITSPINQGLWGVAIVDNEGGVYKIRNDGPRKEKMNLAVNQKLTLWIPNNGDLSKCPQFEIELLFGGGERVSTIATCSKGAK